MIVILVLCSLLIFVNLCGITLFILSYILSNDCRTPVGLLIFNTAICDIFAALRLTEDSLELTHELLYDTDESVLKQVVLCKLITKLKVCFYFGQAFNLIAIAINRYIRVTNLALYNSYLDYNLHRLSVVFVWCLSIICQLCHLYFMGFADDGNYTNKFSGKQLNYTICRSFWKTNDSVYRILSNAAFTSPFSMLLVITPIWYVYFIQNRRELIKITDPGTKLPSICANARNLRLHICTITCYLLTYSRILFKSNVQSNASQCSLYVQ